jgi:hypothetical protein
MTKTQFRKKTKSLKPEINKLIDEAIEKLLNSGCVELSDYENNYILPKLFMAAFSSRLKSRFEPPYPTPKQKEEIKNIEYFI